jgi:hypothetical protein
MSWSWLAWREEDVHNKRWTRNLVCRVRLVIVDVVMNTWIIGSVKLSSWNTARYGGAGSSDAEVDALGVELSTADIVGGVEGEDLVAKDVVSRHDVGGNPDRPGKVIGDQFIGRPLNATKGS